MKIRRFALFANLLLGGVLMLAVWVMVVWVASRPALKQLIDLTPQRVNSVDPVTTELLKELRAEKAEIEFHLFYQQYDGTGADDAQRQSLRIRERLVDVTRLLLRRYQYLGAESVKFTEHLPYTDTAAYREAALAFGYSASDHETLVVAVRMPGKERRHRKLSLVSDLAVIDLPNQPGTGPAKRMPVPVLKDYKGEAQITSALKSLLVQGTPVAYLLKGYSTAVGFGVSSAGDYGGLLAKLQQVGFEVRELNFRETPRVPSDADVVLVIEPKREIAARDADLLFDYVKRGGRLFVNYSWSPIGDMNPTGGRLGELLGYELSERPVFHKIADVGRRAGGDFDGTDGVARLAIRANRLHPTTKRLAVSGQPFEVAFARQLRERAGAPQSVRREPLLSTGPKGWLAVMNNFNQPDNKAPRGITLREFLVGMAFETDTIESDGDAASERAAAGRSSTGQVVVVSGVCCNNAGMRLGFGDFVVNVCNWMADRRVLLDIEGSSYQARYLQLQPQQLDRIWYLTVLWIPGAFLALGLGVWLRRRR